MESTQKEMYLYIRGTKMTNGVEYYSEVKKMIQQFLNTSQLVPEILNEQEKQIIATFCFGMINGYSLKNKKNAIQIQGATIDILIEMFFYSPAASAEFCNFLIECTDKSFHPTMHSIIHRGIQGYYQYEEAKNNELKDNIENVIEVVKNH